MDRSAPDGECPVVVIGSGAGGGTLAHELARRGIEVTVIEAGRRFDLEDFLADPEAGPGSAWETFNWRDRRLMTGSASVVADYATLPTYTLKAVGGTTVHWAAQAYRFREHEWSPLTHWGPVEGVNLIDWPFPLAEMDPYYDAAERRMGVTGTHGVPYLERTRLFEVFEAGCRALGYDDVFEGHIAVDPRGLSAPMDKDAWRRLEATVERIALASGIDRPHVLLVLQGCSGGPKWSALNSEIPRAEATGRCRVLEQCMALRVEHDDGGRATGVLYADAEGAQHFLKARVVCLAANSIESTRLLLNSGGGSLFPHGLANSSGHVGRNYMRSIIEFIYGQFDTPVNMHHGNPVPGFTFGEAHSDPARGFVGGISLAAVGYGQPLFAAYAKQGPLGRNYAEMFPYLAGVVATGIDLPTSASAVSLHPDETDKHGLPVPVLNLDPHPNELAMQAFAIRKADELLTAAGASKIIPCASLPSSHNNGTNRMSANPADGVCDKWGRAHDVPNLFISDGSVFPSVTVGHPTLTIVALAIRQAEHIAAALGRGEL